MVIEMRRFTDFIVKHRIVILIVFIIFSLFSIYLNTKVNINEDILKYLPKSSETKQGKDTGVVKSKTMLLERNSSAQERIAIPGINKR